MSPSRSAFAAAERSSRSPHPVTGFDRRVPLLRPQPPRLSEHTDRLREIEQSGIFSNYGPVNGRLEQALIDRFFHEGSCVTTCNATLGLMLAIRDVMDSTPAQRPYALMPSFTFAAAAHAAAWCGLTPLFCDIDPVTWLPCAAHEEELLQEYGDRIAVIVPYATFGNNLDLPRYERLAESFGVPVVVDAAASMGSLDAAGRAFGAGFRWPVVFSMHATKAFSVGEGGFIYSADQDCIERLRTMASFGFGQPRSATSIGLNAKLSEVAALTALLELEAFDHAIDSRGDAADQYASELDTRAFQLQQTYGHRQMRSFMSVLLPSEIAPFRGTLAECMQKRGVGTGSYFSPHVAEQPYFQQTSRFGPLPVTDDVAARVLNLPLFSGMEAEEVSHVVRVLHASLTDLTCAGIICAS